MPWLFLNLHILTYWLRLSGYAKSSGFEKDFGLPIIVSSYCSEKGQLLLPRSAAAQTDNVHSVLVRVENVDQHYAKTSAAGVRIIRLPESYAFGERQYTAEDCGGHIWTFSQTIDDIDPASWGGILCT